MAIRRPFVLSLSKHEQPPPLNRLSLSQQREHLREQLTGARFDVRGRQIRERVPHRDEAEFGHAPQLGHFTRGRLEGIGNERNRRN